MENEKNKKIIAIVLVILVIIVLGINLFKDNDKDKIDKSINLLEDRNRFFEVSNSVDKFIKFVSSRDNDSVYKILNEEYLKNNNITKENVLNIVPNISGNYVFGATSMYEQQLDKTTYKYYVKGYYYQETIDGNSSKTDYYVIVYFYTKSMTFSIEPYNGEMFEGDL